MADPSLAQKYFEQLQEANRRITELESSHRGNRAAPKATMLRVREQVSSAPDVEGFGRLTLSARSHEREDKDEEIQGLKDELAKLKGDVQKSTGVETTDAKGPMAKVHMDEAPQLTFKLTFDGLGLRCLGLRCLGLRCLGLRCLGLRCLDSYRLPNALDQRISSTVRDWQFLKAYEWWIGFKLPKSMGCVSSHLLKVPVYWHEEEGQYACALCREFGRVCFRWDESSSGLREDSFVLLPLHANDRVKAGEPGADDPLGKWIRADKL